MLKQKYFLTDIFILSTEKQPIKLSWRKIEWLHILLTEVKIDSDTQSVTSLSVAPLAVLPEFQRKGIGGDVDSVSPSEGSTFGLRHSSRIGA